MSRSSSASSSESPVRTVKSSEPQERPRSLSCMPADQYYCPEGTPGTSRIMEEYGPEDISRLRALYRELLMDNMRLWECINNVRSNNNRVPAPDVLKSIYALSDDEFFRHYPCYKDFRESGNGALDSKNLAGGCYDDKKYVYHLLEHNSGLMRENARLKHCIHILANRKEVSVDSVVSHCFGMDDENFIRSYPLADRDQRLRASLKKLREEEKKKRRTFSLPGPLQNLSFRLREKGSRFSFDRAGPSHTNNNDICCAGQTMYNSTARVQVDQMGIQEGRHNGHHRMGRWKDSRCDPWYGDRMATPLDTPEVFPRRGSMPRLAKSRVKGRARADGDKYMYAGKRCPSHGGGSSDVRHGGIAPVPYMVTQHPYNWATSNNSSGMALDNDSQQEHAETEFQPEDNEENGVTYRKHQNGNSLSRKRMSSRSDQRSGWDKHLDHKSRGPRISYSRSPARTRRSSLTKTRPSVPGSNEDGLSDLEHSRATPQKPAALSLKKPPPTENRKSLSRAGKCSYPSSNLPRKPHIDLSYKRPPQEMKRPPKARQAEGNFLSDSKRDRYSGYDRQNQFPDKTADRSTKVERSRKQRPVYYDPSSQTDCESGLEESRNEDYDPPFQHTVSQSPWGTTLPENPYGSLKKRVSTSLSRSFSDEMLARGLEHTDLDQSRNQLLDFRELYLNSAHDCSGACPLNAPSLDSPGPSAVKPCVRSRSSGGHTKMQQQDLGVENNVGVRDAIKDRAKSVKDAQRRSADHDHSLMKSTNKAGCLQGSKNVKNAQTFQKQGYLLSNNKSHRVPTRRPLSKSREDEEKQMNTNCSSKPRIRESSVFQHAAQNENCNRDSTDSSMECSDQAAEDVGHLHIPHSQTYTDTGNDIVDQLIKEKRQLYQKYQQHTHQNEERDNNLNRCPEAWSPQDSRCERPVRHDGHQCRPSQQNQYQDISHSRNHGVPKRIPSNRSLFKKSHSFDGFRNRPPSLDRFVDRSRSRIRFRNRSPSRESFPVRTRDAFLSRPPSRDGFLDRPRNVFQNRSPSFDVFVNRSRNAVRNRSPSLESFPVRARDTFFNRLLPFNGFLDRSLDARPNRSPSFDEFIDRSRERFQNRSPTFDRFLGRSRGRFQNRSPSFDTFLDRSRNGFRNRSPSYERFLGRSFSNVGFLNRPPPHAHERFLGRSCLRGRFLNRPPSFERFLDRSCPREDFWNRSPSHERFQDRSRDGWNGSPLYESFLDRSHSGFWNRSPLHERFLDRSCPRERFLDRLDMRDRSHRLSEFEERFQDVLDPRKRSQSTVDVRDIFQDILDMRKKFQKKLDVCERFHDIVDTREKFQEKLNKCQRFHDKLDMRDKLQGTTNPQEGLDERSNMYGRAEDISDTCEGFGDKSCHPKIVQNGSNERGIGSSRLNQRSESSDNQQPRQRLVAMNRFRSLSEPSPRPFKCQDPYSRKRLSFSDPLCHTCVIHKANGSSSLEPPEARMAESANNESKSGQYSESVGRHRAQTHRLREQNERHQQDRPHGDHRVRDLHVNTPLVQAYSNLGVHKPTGSRNNKRGGRCPTWNKNGNAQIFKLQTRQTRHTKARPPSASSSDDSGVGNSSTVNTSLNNTRTSGTLKKKPAETPEQPAEENEAEISSFQGFHDVPPTLLGEMAFQLEQRIIRSVFTDGQASTDNKDTEKQEVKKSWETGQREVRHRFYGYTVQNMPQKIRTDCRDPITGNRDTARQARLLRRYQDTITYLRHNFGYHVHKHGRLSQRLIQKYGVFSSPPDAMTIARLGLSDFRSLRNHVIRMSTPIDRVDMLLLVDCLRALGQKEGLPVLAFK